jgi:hypothetical protein
MDRSTDCDLADSTTARLVDAEAAQSGLRVELDQARAETQVAQDRIDALTRQRRGPKGEEALGPAQGSVAGGVMAMWA